MNKTRVYVVEDMAIPRMSLEEMLLNNGFELSGSSATAEGALKDLEEISTDLILLDINLAGQKNGNWLAQHIRKNFEIPIIFLTAYSDQQTLKEVMAVKPNGYLMKPYQEPVLLTTIQIAIENFKESVQQNGLSTNDKEVHNYIFIKDSFKKVKLSFNDICYIKSDGNYLEVMLENKKHVIRNKLLDFKEQLPKQHFLQCHQRYLVNIYKIEAIGKNHLELNKETIPVSSRYKADIEKALTIK